MQACLLWISTAFASIRKRRQPWSARCSLSLRLRFVWEIMPRQYARRLHGGIFAGSGIGCVTRTIAWRLKRTGIPFSRICLRQGPNRKSARSSRTLMARVRPLRDQHGNSVHYRIAPRAPAAHQALAFHAQIPMARRTRQRLRHYGIESHRLSRFIAHRKQLMTVSQLLNREAPIPDHRLLTARRRPQPHPARPVRAWAAPSTRARCAPVFPPVKTHRQPECR